MNMKSFSTIVLFLTYFFPCIAQDHNTKKLLDKINKATDSVYEGEFILHENYSKISVGEDSSKRSSYTKCLFKKLPPDSLTGYHLASMRSDGYTQVYDGNFLFTMTPWDKTLVVTDKSKYPSKVKELKNDYFVFPFFKSLNQNLQLFNKDSMLSKVKVIGIELYNGEECYKIQTGISSKSEKRKTEAYIFVSKLSLLPIRQYIRFETIIGQAKEIRVFDYWITDLKTDPVFVGQFTKGNLSDYDKEKQYSPSVETSENHILPKGAKAPDWELPSLDGRSISLGKLKGKIVIMDFWYKSCAPCQKQMIALQALHDKFDKSVVVFVGINTIDDPIKDKLDLFLKNRNITMTSVYNGKSIVSAYGVYASPALFVIDKEGNISFALEGYSDTLIEDVTRVIEQLF